MTRKPSQANVWRSSVVGFLAIAALALAHGVARAEDLCQHLGSPDDEIADCTDAITSQHRQGDDLAQAYNNRAEAWMRKGNFDKALADLQEALQLHPQYPVAMLNRGLVYQQTKKFDLAQHDYAALIGMSPMDGAALTARASLWGTMDQLNKSIDDSTKAIEALAGDRASYPHAPTSGAASQTARALYNRGLALKLSGDIKGALADYKKAARANPADPNSWRRLPVSWPSMSDSERVEELYRGIKFSADLNTSDPRVYDVTDMVNTWYGNVLLFRRDVSAASAIMFNGEVVYEAPGMYVSIDGVFHTKGYEAILIGTNPGGSATPDTEMAFLIIDASGRSSLLKHPDFIANTPDGVKSQMDKRGGVRVHLGFKAGKEMVAELSAGKLLVHAFVHQGRPLSDKNCRWLYDEAKRECTAERVGKAGCSTVPATDVYLGGSVGSMLTYTFISNMPGFSQRGLGESCRALCEGQAMRYRQFGRAACTRR
jgi:tetratricopeptide (TPR) repeat protein